MTDPLSTTGTGGGNSPQGVEGGREKKSFGIVRKTVSQAKKFILSGPPKKSEENPYAENEDISFGAESVFRGLKKSYLKKAELHFKKIKENKNLTGVDKAMHLGKGTMSAAAFASIGIAERAGNMFVRTVSKPDHINAIKGLRVLAKNPEKFDDKKVFHKLLKNIQRTDFSTQKNQSGVRKRLGMPDKPIKITQEQYKHSEKVIGINLAEAIFCTDKPLLTEGPK